MLCDRQRARGFAAERRISLARIRWHHYCFDQSKRPTTMDKQTLKHLGWITASFSLATLFAGCADMDAAESVDESAAYEATNGFSFNGFSFNGFSFNGRSALNGSPNAHGISMLAGLGTSSGLSSTSGLMTTPMGRRSVSYLASCALGSGQTLTKADQTGKNHNFAGGMGIAPS